MKSARKEGGTALLARRRQSRSSRIRELSVLFSLEARSFLCLLKHTPRTDERDGMAGGGEEGRVRDTVSEKCQRTAAAAGSG